MSSTPLPRRLVAVSFAVALALGMAGCSSGDKTETTSAGDAASDARDLGDAARDLDRKLGTDGCYRAAAAWATIVAKPLQIRATGASQEDLDAYRKQVDEFRKDLDESLRGDYDVLAKAYGDYAEAMRAIGTTDPAELMKPEMQRKLQEADALLETSEVEQARDRVQAYFETCAENSGN